MKEIIEDILEEEKKARERVLQARECAKQIRLDADLNVKAMAEEARKNAQETSKALVQQAKLEANEEREEALSNTSDLFQTIRSEKKEIIDQTMDVLFRMILGEEIKDI